MNERKSIALQLLKHIFVFYLPAGITASFAGFAVLALGVGAVRSGILLAALAVLGSCAATGLYYLLLKKQVSRATVRINAVILLLAALIFTLFMLISRGNMNGARVVNTMWATFPYFPLALVAAFGGGEMVFPAVFGSMITAFAVSYLQYRDKTNNSESALGKKALGGVCALLAALIALNSALYINRPEAKYSGHGLDYMNGYSSTDFTDYTVYSENSKLVTLDHPAEFTIDDPEKMPVMDGAEACYPVYAAAAKAVYKDIDLLEKRIHDNNVYSKYNGKIVQFTNSIYGLSRLISPKELSDRSRVDLFFGARPSEGQLEMAEKNGVELEITPIGREAFVFFVETDNPVDDLSSEQLRSIYHGDITNWSEVGGKKQTIKAFQRPRDSGSQTVMEYFMGSVELKTPDTYETVGGMGDVINRVAQYNSEPGALGYTFRYFLEELHQEDGVKMLSVDGVYPSIENIKNGSYPLTVDLCLITRKNDSNENVRRMVEFMLSADGQYIVEKTGYAPVG